MKLDRTKQIRSNNIRTELRVVPLWDLSMTRASSSTIRHADLMTILSRTSIRLLVPVKEVWVWVKEGLSFKGPLRLISKVRFYMP